MSFLHERVSEAKLAHINDAITASINAQFGDGGIGEPPSPPGETLLDLNTPLTSPPFGYGHGCPNAQDRPGMWARDDPQALETLVSPFAEFLNRLGQLCLGAEIRECRNQACLGNKQLIQDVAPACEWTGFRDWAIVAMSCQASFTDKQRLTRSHTHLATTVSLFNTLLAWYKNRARAFDNVLVGSRRRVVDLVQVCDIIYWMLTIQARIGVGNVVEGKWGPDFIPERVIRSSVQRASEISSKIGLCQNRIQNLALASERKEADLPALVEAAQKHPNLKHEHHEVCTTDFCRFAEIDSTKVEQLHKCNGDPSRCGQYEFPLDIVEKSIWSDGSTAWSCLERRMVTPGEKYVAISHTWSDGTGVGVIKGEKDMKEKIVNRCLFDYFARIVARLDCMGIWWDTISIPLEKSARRKAVNNMQVNYASASYTVVHDKYLLQFDWREDGTPCLALVLSPWFTRGWTALELAKSRFVKVLYKGSHPNEPVIKDLDKDILARDPAHSTRAHWIASSLIRRLRKAVTDVSDILTILGPRSTSWERDNKLIAALLAEWTDGGYDRTEADHTRAILARLGKMGMSSLFHGYETIAATGGFSWCPHALRDLPSQSTGDLQDGVLSNTTLTVDARGAIIGSFYYRLVTSADTRDGALVQHNACPRRARSQYAIEQNISNPPDGNRTKNALRSRQTCLLLRDHWQSAGPALLVATVGKEAKADSLADIIDCRYIASVFDHTRHPTEQYDSRYKFGTMRLGNERGRPDVDASRLLGLVGDYGDRDGWDGGGTSGRGGFGSSIPQPLNEPAGEEEEDDEDVSSDGADGWEFESSDGPAVPKGYRPYH